MGKRSHTLLFLLGAATGGAAMLVGLSVGHDYGLQQARLVAERQATFRAPSTGTPPPEPNAEQAAAARPLCEAFARASGLSTEELVAAGGLLFRVPPPRDVDYERLDLSFGSLDRLRMTLAGLTKTDRERATASVLEDPQDAYRQRRLTRSLAEALRPCRRLSEHTPRAG